MVRLVLAFALAAAPSSAQVFRAPSGVRTVPAPVTPVLPVFPDMGPSGLDLSLRLAPLALETSHASGVGDLKLSPELLEAPTLAPLDHTARAIARNEARGRTQDNARELDLTFDGLRKAQAPAVAAARFDAPGAAESFAESALRRFFPGLKAGEAAAVYKADSGVRPLGRPTDGQLDASVKLSPLTNPEREAAIRDLFLQAGADPSEILTQAIPRGWRGGEQHYNIQVIKRGRSDKILVIGGHHDKVHVGAGTIDNWTGATMVANLYKALRDVETEHTLVFLTFGAEEQGLVGSRHWLSQLPDAERAKIQAMVNLDTLAVDGTFSWLNNSDRALLDRADRVAAAAGLDLERKGLRGGDSDHSSFRRYGIPAMMFFGASENVIWDIIHSQNDTYASFSLPHYVNNYEVALAMLKDLDADPPARRARPARPRPFDAARFRHWTTPPPGI